ADVVERLARSANIIHVARLPMVPYVEPLLRHRERRGGRQAFVLDLDVVETVARARWLKAGLASSVRGRVLGCYDLPRLWWYQRKAIRAFDRVFVCSEKDQRRFANERIVVIPNGADPPRPTRVDRSDEKTILYVGQLAWKPNADAAVFLA